jgi:hypothetical protein
METVIMNMRWAGYLLFALGLINWRYQNSFEKGAPIWIIGLALIAATYIPAVSRLITTKLGIALTAIVVVTMVAVAFFA